MFQVEWANKELWKREVDLLPRKTMVDKSNIDNILAATWEEHCLECAVPECYSYCPVYQRRGDGACARFVYGIIPNKQFKGQYNFGADIRFRKWGKIEADLNAAFPASKLVHKLLNMCQTLPIFFKSKLLRKLRKINLSKEIDFDNFILECYSENKEPFTLLLEYFTLTDGVRSTKFRHSFIIRNGFNYHFLPFRNFSIKKLEGYLYLYPENSNPEKRIIFTWLDFVKYNKSNITESIEGESNIITKVKCVAWDLDNTLWNGTLIENNSVKPIRNAIRLIKRLDAKGILQTIVSKNDFEIAWQRLKEIKIDKYFLHPAINWGQKSENLIEISKRLNIDLDTIAVIDDSIFEREEIKKALPTVRVYSEKEISKIDRYSEFRLNITNMSAERRKSYLVEIKRNVFKTDFAENYDEYLASCEMVIDVFIPKKKSDILRSWELVQRSNQLNLSSRRYSIVEFNNLLRLKNIISISLSCKDRFGDYGIIGFMSIKLSSTSAILEDFVLSCRVAQKKIEYTFIKCISELFFKNGIKELFAKLVCTKKNDPLRQVFRDLPFEVVSEVDNLQTLKYDLNVRIIMPDIIRCNLDDSILNLF